MGIEWYRDLIICLSGVVAIVVLVFIAILSYSSYRKITQVFNSIKDTSTAVRGIASDVREEIISPVAQVMAIIQGVRQGISMANQFFKKSQQEGGKHG